MNTAHVSICSKSIAGNVLSGVNVVIFSPQTMSGKEKGKFDDMAKQDKVRYDNEMMHFAPGGKKGRKKDPNAPKRPSYVPHTQTGTHIHGWSHAQTDRPTDR